MGKVATTGVGPSVRAADRLAHVVDDPVEVVVGQGEADEQHVAGDEQRLDDAREGRAAIGVAQIVFPREDDVARVRDRAVQLEEPAGAPDDRLVREDGRLMAGSGRRHLEEAVIIRGDDFSDGEGGEQAMREGVVI
jgi:hypothetical protein